MRADRKELNSHEAKDLKLTTAYNPAANGKIERGHAPIVNALVKSGGGR